MSCFIDRPVLFINTTFNNDQIVNISEGNNLTVMCYVLDSKPAADNISWLHNSELVAADSHQDYSEFPQMAALTISSITRSA